MKKINNPNNILIVKCDERKIFSIHSIDLDSAFSKRIREFPELKLTCEISDASSTQELIKYKWGKVENVFIKVTKVCR